MTRLKRLITQSEHILIATHRDPDADGICAALIVAELALRYTGRRPHLYCHSPIPRKYRFLMMGNRFARRAPRGFDLLVAVDSASLERIFPAPPGWLERRLSSCRIVNIDHHASNDQFGQLRIIEEDASSTCEMLYHAFRRLRLPIPTALARVFYAGIYNETGGFDYPNTTRSVMSMAADLVGTGIKPAAVAKALNDKTLAGTRLLSAVLDTITIRHGVGTMYLSRSMLRRCRARMQDSEHFISFLQAIDRVRVAVFLREEPGGTRISMRSDGVVDVNEVAHQFGGGGHRLAAGLRMSVPPQAAKRKLLRAIETRLKRVRGTARPC